MIPRLRVFVAALAAGALSLSCAFAQAPPQAFKAKPAAGRGSAGEIFGLAKVHELHLEMSAKEWQKMQPAGGPKIGAFFREKAPKRPDGQGAEKPAEAVADVHRGGFGMEFPWAQADLTAGGKTYEDVGIRYKGNFTYMASTGGLKRSLKIDFDRYHDSQQFHGLRTINLNSGITDSTRARESLSFAVFRAAGVPAPRTAFAEVTLTVPGKYERELMGLYTLIEQVDKTFLEDRFGSAGGLLLKPEGLRGLEYLGDRWAPYEQRYAPKTKASKAEQQRLIEFVRLVNRGDDAQFRKEIGSYLDVDEFLRYVAANALLANLDSFLAFGHNYYLYLRPDASKRDGGKFVFIPWDVDLSLGRWPMGGTPQQQIELSISRPYPGENKLIDRLLAMKEVKEKYDNLLRELAASCFAKETLLKQIETIEQVTKEPLAREKKAAERRKESASGFGFGPLASVFASSPTPRAFVEQRTQSIAAQLAGKSKGYVPAFGFGAAGQPPPGFGPGDFLAKPVLAALDGDRDGKLSKAELVAAAKKFFKDCDTENKGSIDRRAIAEGLNRVFPAPPGFGPRGGADGQGGPGKRPAGKGPAAIPLDGGPGMILATAMVKRADSDKDGKVTLEEFVAAAEALFSESDNDKSSQLDEKETAKAIGLFFPPPDAFGPPKGPPGGFRPGEPIKPAPKKQEKRADE
jgi:spore coat protein H